MNEHTRSIPDHFIPHFCVQCGAPMKQDPDIWNHFVCTSSPSHQVWPQSPYISNVIIVDEDGFTYLIRRGIPPDIGELFFPGGWDKFGDTGEDTVIRKAWGKAQICLEDARGSMIYSQRKTKCQIS